MMALAKERGVKPSACPNGKNEFNRLEKPLESNIMQQPWANRNHQGHHQHKAGCQPSNVPLAGFILVLLGRFAACAGRFNGDHCVCHAIATDATGLGVLPFIRKFSNSTLCLGCFVEKRLNCWRGWFVDFRRSGSWYFRCSAIESPTTNVERSSRRPLIGFKILSNTAAGTKDKPEINGDKPSSVWPIIYR